MTSDETCRDLSNASPISLVIRFRFMPLHLPDSATTLKLEQKSSARQRQIDKCEASRTSQNPVGRGQKSQFFPSARLDDRRNNTFQSGLEFPINATRYRVGAISFNREVGNSAFVLVLREELDRFRKLPFSPDVRLKDGLPTVSEILRIDRLNRVLIAREFGFGTHAPILGDIAQLLRDPSSVIVVIPASVVVVAFQAQACYRTPAPSIVPVLTPC